MHWLQVSATRQQADHNGESEETARSNIHNHEVSGAADDGDGGVAAVQVEVKREVIVNSKTENVERVVLPEKERSCCSCSIV